MIHGLAVAAAMAAVGGATWVWWRIERAERRDALRALAARLGGRALPSDDAPERVEAERSGIALAADFAHRRFAVRGEPLWGVRVVARWALPPGPTFVLHSDFPDPLDLERDVDRIALPEALAEVFRASGADAAIPWLLAPHRAEMLAIGRSLEISAIGRDAPGGGAFR